MAEFERAQPSIWPTLTACAIAAVFAAWMGLVEHGRLLMLAGPLAPVFWAGTLVWLVCVSAAITRQRQWWLLLTAPIVLYPAFMWGWLLLACLVQGACL